MELLDAALLCYFQLVINLSQKINKRNDPYFFISRIILQHCKKMTDIIVSNFNKIINDLLQRLERKSRSDEDVSNLDRLQKRISLLKRTMGPESLIENAAPIIIEYAEQITECNDKFFTEMDVRAECIKKGGKIDSDNEYIFSMINNIKVLYLKASIEEKKAIFVSVNGLLLHSIEYIQAISAS